MIRKAVVVAGVPMPMEEDQMEDSSPPSLLPNGITLVKVRSSTIFFQMSFILIPEGGEAAVELLPGDFEPSRRANHPHSAPAQATCPS